VFDFTHGWIAGRYPATPIINTTAIFRDAGVTFLPQGNPARPELRYTFDPSYPGGFNTAANLDASVQESLINDWRTREVIPAGYFQSEVTLLSDLRATLGLRYEQTRTTI